MDADSQIPPSAFPRYARFGRRLKGMLIDWVVSLVLIFGTMFLVISIGDQTSSRVFGILAVAIVLLYEPVLVSLTGSTLGHYMTNLRVVDQVTSGNISFVKAVGRFVLKSLLGWYSFIAMMATRRNQAVHDWLTKSTVQMRDAGKALPHHFIVERTDLQHSGMPPAWRRLVVILGYLLVITFAVGLILELLLAVGTELTACTVNCRSLEAVLSIAISLVWLAAIAVLVGLGWRGRLFGARKRGA
jgi:hypothetical protein